MLNDLVSKIKQTQLPEKDAEAESFLQQNLGGNPDSLYILAQTVVVQNLALDRAKAQVQQLQQQVQQLQQQLQDAHEHAIQSAAPPQHTSFLSSLLGRRDPAPPPPPPPSYASRPAAPPPDYYPPAPAYAPQPAYVPQYTAAPPPPSGGSSFLRSAATTAAGVAAGALAFEGVESLIHGFGHEGGGFGGPSFGGGGFGGGGFGERPVEETVINNYYDDPSQNAGGMQEHHEHEASFDERPDSFGGDQAGDGGAQLRDASYEPGFTEPQGIDTLDDDQTTGGIDDSSSFDDSGSFDDGGGDDSGVI